MRLWRWLAVSALFTLQQAPAPLSAQQAAPPNSKTWIGRYAEFEEFLKTATVERTTGTPVGILSPRHAIFPPGGLASGASIKKIKPGRYDGFVESYKSEIAAYKMDRLLKLDMVPPTIERQWEREGAAWQIWVDNTRMLKDVQAQKVRSPDAEGWNRQYHRVQAFDNLVGNIDENAGNLLFDPAWNFIKIDHSRAFTDTLTLPFPIGNGPRDLKQIDRPFFNRLKALDRDVVRKEIGEWLTENNALPAVMKRRDDMVKKFEELAKKNGESAVFVSWPGEE